MTGSTYHRSKRLRVIGLTLTGVLLVGALGAVGGVAFDPEPTRRGEVVQPGTVADPGGAGRSVPGRAAFGAPPADASVVTLQNGVGVYVPPGWQVTGQQSNSAALSDGTGNFAFALTGDLVPDTDAGALIIANIPGLLPAETYTQQGFTDVGSIAPFGSVVSAAYLDYEALIADNQGSVSLHGQIYAGVRQDDVGLILLVEHVPADSWDKEGFPAMTDLVNLTYGAFGGL